MCLANKFANFCVILWHLAHHSPAHMWALCWSGNGTRRASAETIVTWHDLFQLWLRALSQLQTQSGLVNVSQSMPHLASNGKEACSDASSLSDYFKFEFAGQVGIIYTLSSVGNCRKKCCSRDREVLQSFRPTFLSYQYTESPSEFLELGFPPALGNT